MVLLLEEKSQILRTENWFADYRGTTVELLSRRGNLLRQRMVIMI